MAGVDLMVQISAFSKDLRSTGDILIKNIVKMPQQMNERFRRYQITRLILFNSSAVNLPNCNQEILMADKPCPGAHFMARSTSSTRNLHLHYNDITTCEQFKYLK